MTTDRLLRLARERTGIRGRLALPGLAPITVAAFPLWPIIGQRGLLAVTFRTSRIQVPDELADKVGTPRGGCYVEHRDDPDSGYALRYIDDEQIAQLHDTALFTWTPLDLSSGVRDMSGAHRIAEAVALAGKYERDVAIDYVKDGTTEPETRRVRVTWTGNPASAKNPDGYGTGATFGVVDSKDGKPRTFNLRGVRRVGAVDGVETPAWDPERGGYYLPNDTDPFADDP